MTITGAIIDHNHSYTEGYYSRKECDWRLFLDLRHAKANIIICCLIYLMVRLLGQKYYNLKSK